jgi:hypothetical protein
MSRFSLAEGGEARADVDVEVLARRAAHLDDAALFERENFRQLHPALIELDLNVDRDQRYVGKLLERQHGFRR